MATSPSLRKDMELVEWDIMGKTTILLTLNLSDRNLSQLPDELFELTELEALKLDVNKDIRLSEKLIRLTNLKVLSLVECNLDTVPAVVRKLQQLETLILSNNKNITLPDEMCSLVNLTYLDLASCDLTSVPMVVIKLSQLKGLRLSYNNDIKLPDEMSSLVNLTYLDLDECGLYKLPPVVLKLLNLQALDLSRNCWISLPEDLCRLENIKVLTLSQSNSTTVPPAVLKLSQLEELDLGGNSGIHLPDELAGLTNIRVLNLGNTHMHTVPPVVWRMTQLKRLDLSNNPLQTLPAEIGQLTNVKHLDLHYCELRTLPPEVGRLAQLQWLDLRSNPLQTLPAEVGQLTNVKHLHLSYCQLCTLPPEVGTLTQLEWLVLSINPLQTLPAEVGQLTNVKHLNLHDCQLRTLPPEVGRLAQLERLDLRYNPLHTLPAEIGQLTNVKHLNLSYCQLHTLPPEVWRLTQLEWLGLSSNPLQTLPAEVGKLTNVKHLDLCNCELRKLPPEVGRLTQLERLNLGSNPLQTLPVEVGQLTNIKHLNLSHCELRTLPAEVWRLTQLEWLGLSHNPLQTLPAEIGQLINIKHLDLSYCELRILPPGVGRLTHIEWLDMNSNPLQKLPTEVEQLINVKHLDLHSCRLRTLPPEVGGLAQLEWLDLNSNPLQTLPGAVGELTNVKHLDLSKCELTTLPPEVGRLTQLEGLSLSYNPLLTLPTEIGQLINVKNLYLSHCQLCTLPPEVGGLTQLEWLDLNSNPLQTLPAEIGQVTNVKHLDLSHCELHTLPPEVGRLTQLEWLDLSSTPLRTLPAEVGQLTNVKHLNLYKCQLRTLPPEVGRLTQLEWLNLSWNPLQTLPAEVGQLTNVKHLDLSHCELQTLPSEVWRLTQLEWLDLISNPLQTLPAEIGQLTNVKHLDLSNCQLYTLPPEVGRLTQLEWLDVRHNRLQTLPADVAQLSSLSHLEVSSNPLIKPPKEVCEQGITSIRQYFRELERSEEKVSARLKVVVLGEKMAGKTSLVQTLQSGRSTLTEEEDRTHCVQITQWAPDVNITFEVYDFGGHDVYHLTHQFFLTQDALNLLAVNLKTYRCTEQSYKEAVGFWLDTLNTRVPGAVVTLVGSKADLCSDTDIEEKTSDIRERFKQQNDAWQQTIQQQLKKLEMVTEVTDQGEVRQQLERTRQLLTRPLRLTGVCCVSSAEPTSGLDTLRSHILETANNVKLFPILRRVLPLTWVDFEQQLRDLRGKGTEKYQSAESTSHDDPLREQSQRTKWLTREECLQQGQLAGLTADRLEPVLSYLQQVGTILRYTDIPELKDFVFHDPSGLIDVIKELFHHDLKMVFTNKNPQLKGFSNTRLKKVRKHLSSRGYLPREVVIALLGPHATPVGNVDVITNLMEHFGLCYTEWYDEQDGETPNGYCIPWYIEDERPASMKRDSHEQEKKELTLTCEISWFCPRGLFERLSVVVNKLIKSRQDWKDVIVAVRESLPVIVYREKKDEHVNIVVKLTVPAEAVQGIQVIWNVIGPLKDKLSTLLKEWPGLLYHMVYSTFTQQGQQKDLPGDQQMLTSSVIISTFEVGPEGCTVQQSGATLEFPEGCVDETRFISVEVETVPVTDDVRTNFTAMSAVLTVEQDFPQQFLRPVTVRLPWAWTQDGEKRKTTEKTKTVVLHYDREDGWTVFPTDLQEGPETVVFPTDRFQSYVVTRVKDVCNELVQLWEFIWSGYCQDKVYLIVMPNEVFLPKRFINLLCVHKLDDASDFFSIGNVSRNHQITQRISMTNKEQIRAYLLGDFDIQIDPKYLRLHPHGMVFEFPPADRNRYSFAVEKRSGVPEKDIYEGHVSFERLGLKGNVKSVTTDKIDGLPILLHRASQGATPSSFLPEDVASQEHDTGLRRRSRSPSQKKQQARPEPTASNSPPPRQHRLMPNLPIIVAIAMVALATIMYLFYSVDYFNNPFRLLGGAPQNETSKLRVDSWLPLRMDIGVPLTIVAGHLAAFFGIWFFVCRKGKPVVLLVNDEFGTSKGGISTINGQLGDLLTSKGAKVLCTVLNATEQEKREARSHGIELLVPNTPEGDKRTPTLNWLTYDNKSRYPNLPSDINVIVGHADVTSKAARNIKKERLLSAKFILYNHVMPEDTEHYKSSDKVMRIGDKTEAIDKDIGEADVVFSVGPTMFDYYRNEIRGLKKPHHMFLPKPSDIFSRLVVEYEETETKVVFSVGRVTGVERLKGYDLLAKAMIIVIERFRKARWRARGVSVEDFAESKEIIQAKVDNETFKFTPLKYCTQQQLSKDFRKAHVVLMPSRAEPFGLVGLEAIAAGVPVLVSSNSGLAEFLRSRGPEFERLIVDIEGTDDEVAERLAQRIIEVLKGGPAEFEAATRLKDKLLASKYWEESHRKFLEECGIPQ